MRVALGDYIAQVRVGAIECLPRLSAAFGLEWVKSNCLAELRKDIESDPFYQFHLKDAMEKPAVERERGSKEVALHSKWITVSEWWAGGSGLDGAGRSAAYGKNPVRCFSYCWPHRYLNPPVPQHPPSPLRRAYRIQYFASLRVLISEQIDSATSAEWSDVLCTGVEVTTPNVRFNAMLAMGELAKVADDDLLQSKVRDSSCTPPH